MIICHKCANWIEKEGAIHACRRAKSPMDALVKERDTLKRQRDALKAKCVKVSEWLERLAVNSEQQAKSTCFEGLAEDCAKDAKTWRATANDIRAAIRECGQ